MKVGIGRLACGLRHGVVGLRAILKSKRHPPAWGSAMEKQSFVHDFQQKLLEMFRASPAADLERNVKALMGQTFNKLELVTRDEFDIQVELLRALRTRVEALEEKLNRSEP
jgi:BMFP domain-containing protein YqiC